VHFQKVRIFYSFPLWARGRDIMF